MTAPHTVVTEAMVEARDWIAKQVAQLSELPHRYAEEIAGLNKVSAALEAALVVSAGVGATVPAGWRMVPEEPTEAMKLAGGMIPDAFKGTGAARSNAYRIYRAMLAATPPAPVPSASLGGDDDQH